MTQAHATQKGAIGLELGDKGSKEMIDAPMLKQVNTLVHCWPFVRLTFSAQAEKTIQMARAAGLPVPTPF
jgi:hypothetical protein